MTDAELLRRVREKFGVDVPPDDPALIMGFIAREMNAEFVETLMAARAPYDQGHLNRIGNILANKMTVRLGVQAVMINRWLMVGIAVCTVATFFVGAIAGAWVYRNGSPVVTNCVRSPQPAGIAYDCLFWADPPPKKHGVQSPA